MSKKMTGLEPSRFSVGSKQYQGLRSKDGEVSVTVNGSALDPHFDLRCHSPTGFEWGYGGSGPAQLSLALLADQLGDDEAAQRLYQDFKWAVVSGLPKNRWSLTSADLRAALKKLAARTM